MVDTKIFDCFMFNDELDLLEMRLQVTSPFIDAFVLVETGTTFSGVEKPMHYFLNQSRFSKWHNKIRHVVVDDMPAPAVKRWRAEVHQRNSLLRGLMGATDQDVVLISDVDEIVHPEVLASLRTGIKGLTGLEMVSTFRFANWELPRGQYACAARAIPAGHLTDPHQQRNHTNPQRIIENAGRHFTALGGINALISKFENYSHDEMDTQRQKSSHYLERSQHMGVDVFSRQLISAVPALNLCASQKALLQIRPDWFDFGELPGRGKRELFRWYANWRYRQASSAEIMVLRLDRDYDDQFPTVVTIAGTELARHVTYVIPRRAARRVRQKLT